MTPQVVVVGGGCSGVLVAVEALRRTDNRVVLIEPTPRLARGVAYEAASPWHLLNSPAGSMSADPDDPNGFLDWCRSRGVAARPGDFLPRPVFGDYLASVLEAASAAAPGRLTVRTTRATGVRTHSYGQLVELDREPPIRADNVVLALGSPRTLCPRTDAWSEAAGGRIVHVCDPWSPEALAAVPRNRPVLLMGTGLTAVDVALTLFRTGQSAPVTAVSRHGLLPRRHPGGEPAAPPATLPPRLPSSLPALIRVVRRSADNCGDWREVVNALRPRLNEVWESLSVADQDRFLRHLARHWEIHRHRMAPAVAEELAELQASGVLRIRAMGPERERGLGATVTCTGPGRLPAAADGLVRTLLDDGQARFGPHGLGLDVGPYGNIVARDGRPNPRLWLVGPLRRGRFWETTAVPEIRAQARNLATALARGRSVRGRVPDLVPQ